jgi:hypothetical protein
MVCLLYGLDPERHDALRRRFDIPDDAAAACRDFAPEVGRSWRRVLEPYRMPSDARITEAFLSGGDSRYAFLLEGGAFRDEVYTLLSGIDWHSAVRVTFQPCDGTAGWSRNGRRIQICDAYIDRFERQLGP